MPDNGMIQFGQAVLGGTSVEEGVLFNSAIGRLGSAISSVTSGGPIAFKGLTIPTPLTAQAATVQLTAAQSGCLCIFDSAAGIVYTLPTASVGLEYSFACTATITSNAMEVATKNVATEFIGGGVLIVGPDTPSSTAGPKWFPANGTSHVALKADGGAKGGAIGSYFTLTCVSTTLWICSGTLAAVTGQTIATPFSTTV